MSPRTTLTLEDLLCSPEAFGLTSATPVQRAICRVSDGIPLGDLARDPDVVDAMGDVSSLPAGQRPLEIYLLSGVRTGKSLFAAALAVRGALSCDLSTIRPGEPVRLSVLSLTRDLADVVVAHLVGTCLSKPALRSLVVGEPSADGVVLRHPSGHDVEICVVAGARAGASVVARWSAGVIFDEATRMSGEEDGVVNFSETRRAALGRLLRGAQLVAIGSPWAPRGPMYEAVHAHWRKPSPQLVVIKAPATAMNPFWWTAARIAQVQASQNGDLIHKTDVLAEFADPVTALIASSDLRRVTRQGPVIVEARPGAEVVFTMDPATRGNSWTVVGAEHRERPDGVAVVRIIYARQWTGTSAAPLSPDATLDEIAHDIRRYRVRECWSDNHAPDFVVDIARRFDLDVQIEMITAASKAAMFVDLAARIADGVVEIPDDPTVRADLQALKKVITRNGVAIDLPRTADGRHCDYAAAIALCVAKAGGGGGTPEWLKAGFAAGAAQFGLQFDPSSLGRKATGEWMGAAVTHAPDIERFDTANGEISLHGAAGKWPAMFYARFRLGEPSRFSMQCEGNTAFARAIANYREVHKL